MLMMDSVTRFAIAQREIGLAIGEPPATRGYTPSVFALLPRLLERAGTSPEGSITGLYTVLVDGDDLNEPIADAVRSILDGHLVLTRSLAHAGHYPAIDVLQSVSRLTGEIVSPELLAAGQRLRSALAALREKEDLIAIGAYQSGSDPLLDATLEHRSRIEAFLRQRVDEPADPDASDARLLELAASLEQSLALRSGEVLDAEEVLTGEPPVEELPGGRLRVRGRAGFRSLRDLRDPLARAQPLRALLRLSYTATGRYSRVEGFCSSRPTARRVFTYRWVVDGDIPNCPARSMIARHGRSGP